MKLLRDFWTLFKLTLRLFWRDPAGMLSAIWLRWFGSAEEAEKRMRRVIDEDKERP